MPKSKESKEKRLLQFFTDIIKQDRLKVDVKFLDKTRLGFAAYEYEGPFRDYVELSRGLLNELTEMEVKAIGLHEIAHAKYNHLFKKFRESFLWFIPFWVILIVPAFLASKLSLTVPTVLSSTALVLYMVSAFIWSFHFGFKRTQWTECQADSYAKRKLDDPEVVITALRKLMNYQRRQIIRAPWKTLNKLFPTHPTLETRIKNLRENLVPAP